MKKLLPEFCTEEEYKAIQKALRQTIKKWSFKSHLKLDCKLKCGLCIYYEYDTKQYDEDDTHCIPCVLQKYWGMGCNRYNSPYHGGVGLRVQIPNDILFDLIVIRRMLKKEWG